MQPKPRDRAYRNLAAATVALAVFDLQSQDDVIRRAAVAWVESPLFDEWLALSGVQIGVDECRAALRRRGLLP
jgi:hypothetical protein